MTVAMSNDVVASTLGCYRPKRSIGMRTWLCPVGSHATRREAHTSPFHTRTRTHTKRHASMIYNWAKAWHAAAKVRANSLHIVL